MKKSLIIILLCILIAMFLPSASVLADTGSKPSVVLEFEDILHQNYYVTLLSKEESTGPFSYSKEPIEEGNPIIDPEEEDWLEIWEAFYHYEDQDNFYFLNYFKKVKNNTFTWSYRPPTIFKVLIYFPDTDYYAVSDIYDWYAFDNYFSVTMDENKHLTLEKNYHYTWELISLFIRIIATIGIELLLLSFFDIYSKKLFLFILVMNLITQIILNLLLNITNFYEDSLSVIIQFVLLELLVMVIEVVAYCWCFKKQDISRKVAIGYGITANICSCGLGLLLAFLIPGIF